MAPGPGRCGQCDADRGRFKTPVEHPGPPPGTRSHEPFPSAAAPGASKPWRRPRVAVNAAAPARSRDRLRGSGSGGIPDTTRRQFATLVIVSSDAVARDRPPARRRFGPRPTVALSAKRCLMFVRTWGG